MVTGPDELTVAEVKPVVHIVSVGDVETGHAKQLVLRWCCEVSVRSLYRAQLPGRHRDGFYTTQRGELNGRRHRLHGHFRRRLAIVNLDGR